MLEGMWGIVGRKAGGLADARHILKQWARYGHCTDTVWSLYGYHTDTVQTGCGPCADLIQMDTVIDVS